MTESQPGQGHAIASTRRSTRVRPGDVDPRSPSGRPLRRTKILATLGPATDAPGVLEQMVAAGLDAVRINCAYDGPEQWAARARLTRETAGAAGRPIAVLADLAGPKLRLPGDVTPREVAAGETVVFSPDGAAGGAVACRWPELATAVEPGRSDIVIGDGTPRLRVASVRADGCVECVVTRAGLIAPRKGFFVTYATGGAASLTPKDLEDLDAVCAIGVDLVALSFVRTAADVRRLRQELEARGSRARVVAKIEKVEACAGLGEILHVSDGVMVARGDLGVEAGVARVPVLQKEIIHRATTEGKLVVTATQMLESMVEKAEPTRAEAADVANAVLDGTSALMLSGETTVGRHPVAAVAAMAEIAVQAEGADRPYHLDIEASQTSVSEAVLQSAAHLSEQLDAAALVIPTTTGGAARAVAKYRPSRPIVAICTDPLVRDQLALEWAVMPATIDDAPDAMDALVERSIDRAVEVVGLQAGETVVVTSGRRVATAGSTNLIQVLRLTAEG